MDISLRSKKDDDLTTIFSQLSNNNRIRRYSQLKHNLSKLQQSVSLLKFYATKRKKDSKNKNNKTSSNPKSIQIEQLFKLRPVKKILKNSNEFVIKDKNNKNKNISFRQIEQTLSSDRTKTQFNNSKVSKNLFMTKVEFKNKKYNNTSNNKSITSTNYQNVSNTFSKSKNDISNNDTLPTLNKTNFNHNSYKNISLIKSYINNTNNNSKNKVKKNDKSVSFDREQFPQITNIMIRNMKKENNHIKKNIYKGMDKFNIMEWYMKTKFKYAQYKYGIAEIQKYFMDIKAYGKPEEEEIEKRKTFFEHVEDVIDEIHDVQQQKQIEKLNKKYGIEQDKKKIIKSKKEPKEFINPKKKQMVELSKALMDIKKRKKMEKKKRGQINDILLKCRQRLHSIDSLENKLTKNETEFNEF